MTGLTFTKATKEQAKLRLAIFGPSGSGKTFTSLRIATGLGGKIAVIDTERGSASKYAGRFEFDVLELPKKDISTYVQGIKAAQEAGYDVLIIDSLTHGWKALLAEVDKLARAKYRGNTWAAWSEGTPKQNMLVDAILDFDGHIMATMRTKTEWTTTTSANGKSRPVRVGLAPEQGKGIEYEFDMLIELSTEHIANVIKDRTGEYQDSIIEKPGEDLGKDLAAWLSTGATPRHWIERGDTAEKFRAFGVGKLKTYEAVLAALEVSDMRDYAGDKQSAVDLIIAAAEKIKPGEAETDKPPEQAQVDENGEVILPKQETEKKTPATTDTKWIDDEPQRKRFFVFLEQRERGAGITKERACELLEVASLHEYGGTMAEAMTAISQALTKRD